MADNAPITRRRWFQFGMREWLFMPLIAALALFASIEGSRSAWQRVQIRALEKRLEADRETITKLGDLLQTRHAELLKLQASLREEEAENRRMARRIEE
jgi:hypothetical protein